MKGLTPKVKEGRLLMGPGPSNVEPRVLRAMSRPLVGHLDPAFLKVMNEIQELLRRVFQTGNPFTIPLSGTGTAGMEASVANFVEEGVTVTALAAKHNTLAMLSILSEMDYVPESSGSAPWVGEGVTNSSASVSLSTQSGLISRNDVRNQLKSVLRISNWKDASTCE